MGCSVHSLPTVEEVQNPAFQAEVGSHQAADNLRRRLGTEAAVDILPVEEEGNPAGLHSRPGSDHLAMVSIKITHIMLSGSTLGLPFQV